MVNDWYTLPNGDHIAARRVHTCADSWSGLHLHAYDIVRDIFHCHVCHRELFVTSAGMRTLTRSHNFYSLEPVVIHENPYL